MDFTNEELTGLEIVKLGYAVDDPTDQNQVLIFRVGFDHAPGAAEALRAIGSYNAFEGRVVAAAIENLPLDPMHRIEVGREYSPVVYVGPFYGSNAEADSERVMAAMRDAAADEVERRGGYVRAWWD